MSGYMPVERFHREFGLALACVAANVPAGWVALSEQEHIERAQKYLAGGGSLDVHLAAAHLLAALEIINRNAADS